MTYQEAKMTCVPLIRKIRVLSYLAILLLGLSPAFGQGTVEEHISTIRD